MMKRMSIVPKTHRRRSNPEQPSLTVMFSVVTVAVVAVEVVVSVPVTALGRLNSISAISRGLVSRKLWTSGRAPSAPTTWPCSCVELSACWMSTKSCVDSASTWMSAISEPARSSTVTSSGSMLALWSATAVLTAVPTELTAAWSCSSAAPSMPVIVIVSGTSKASLASPTGPVYLRQWVLMPFASGSTTLPESMVPAVTILHSSRVLSPQLLLYWMPLHSKLSMTQRFLHCSRLPTLVAVLNCSPVPWHVVCMPLSSNFEQPGVWGSFT
mmetsp:Transcript_73569/g.207791  ORF Transcript_73569/g.207791 Transcript_73569/m.207791 type:complete len:270 (-) Transcript_73569:386-1195(-)